MKTYTATIDGSPVDIFVPELDDPAMETFRFYFPGNAIYGLDVESTAFTPTDSKQNLYGDAVVYAADWRMRLIQFGTEHYAWVLRMDDPVQRAAAIELLRDLSVSFDSYTRIDPMAVAVALGVDIVERTLDSHWLAVLTDPDPESKNGHDLAEQLAKHLGYPVKASDELYAEFDRLYREQNPVGSPMVDYKGKPMVNDKGQPRKVTNAAIKKKEVLIPWGFNHVPIDNPVYVTYAGLDAIAVRRLRPALLKATKSPGSYLRTERYLAEQAIRMQQRGMRVDVERLHDLIIKTKAEMDPQGKVVREMTGISPESTSITKWFTDHGVEWASDHPVTKTGGISLAKGAKELLLGYDMPDETRVVAEAFTRYMNRLDRWRTTQKIYHHLDADGFLHPEIVPLSCRTGRMSGREPNVQNISKTDRELRGLFLPTSPEGLLVECDYSQVEPRTAAALTREQVLIDLIMSGDNIYKITMDQLGVTKAQAKLMQLSILYGVGGNKLAQSIGVTVNEAYRLIDNYWSTYASAKAYWDQMTSLTEVALISGATVPSGHWQDGQPKSRANLNTLCQGNAAVLFKGAIVEFSQVRGRAAHNWMWLHDAIIVEVDRNDPDPVIRDLEESMNFDFRGVPISASADKLIDETGASRWMSGDDAKAIAEKRQVVAA